MKKVDISVGQLVDEVKSGEIQLPVMQRRYVWRAKQVRDLLDSLYRGYPSGSILVWETPGSQPTKGFAVENAVSPFAAQKLLLDGQQRLTSLVAVLEGQPVHVRGRKTPIDILFNLEHPDGLISGAGLPDDDEEEDDDSDDEPGEDEEDDVLEEWLKTAVFVVAAKSIAARPNWVSVSEVFKAADNTAFLERAGITEFKDPRIAKYNARLQRLRSIREYPYVMHVLDKGMSYEEVTEIFVRVNSQGTKLRGSDLAMAQITVRWPESLKILEVYQKKLAERQFRLDLGTFVRAVVMFATDQCRFRTVAKIPLEKLHEGWEKAQQGLDYAIHFLKENCDIEDSVLLSSPFYVLAIAYLAVLRDEELSEKEEAQLAYWVRVASAKGRYSRGSSETLLDEDMATIRGHGSVRGLLETLRQQFGRLDFEVGDITGKNARSPIFSLLFVALRNAEAKDWKTGLKISLGDTGRRHKIQFHHIFPKARIKHAYDRREVNEIANLAFIGGGSNQKISAQHPQKYLAEVLAERGKGALEAQCVPTDPTLHEIERYRDFLVERRQRLVARLNEFIGPVPK
jgi:hypothetical protein